MVQPQQSLKVAARFALAIGLALSLSGCVSTTPGSAAFRREVRPLLANYCFDCHADGVAKGNVAFDQFESTPDALAERELWAKVLRNVRAGLMPPARKTTRPTPQETERLAAWIKTAVFKIDPRNPNPGHVTVRRLNRLEYRNTVRDLLGVDFDAQAFFPPDDSGHGFDNLGEVLTLSPMLLEKYVAAAEWIVARARPIPVGSASDFPTEPQALQARARDFLRPFAKRAFRRPQDEATVERLVALAESVYTVPGNSFEDGIARAMVAVLASARFIFREELPERPESGQVYPFIDQYSLASRLSYFLWSSMPDDELMRLADEGRLRAQLSAQLARMLNDERSHAFFDTFSGQWLRARDIDLVPLEADSDLRRSMRLETEKVFDYVMRGDRSLLELLDSDYTFLNERLARHYGVTDVTGKEMRLAKLPPDSPRGGVLTQGAVLTVTSNPTRTSPVKRGLFILDSILGTPPPPPPPDIPPLEEAAKAITDHRPSLRETLELHRQSPLCHSCHNRMDPLGLAFENFDRFGKWRDEEFGQPLDTAGQLITGEEFQNVRELKRILVLNHRRTFYRTLTEKLLTYALGRGLADYDTETVDQIVAKIEAAEGRSSELLAAVVESAPFQKCQTADSPPAAQKTAQ